MKFYKCWKRFRKYAGRAPHGARGLKYLVTGVQADGLLVAPRTGRVD